MFRENDQIGSYTLVKKLGRGAFGVVWLAEERTLLSTHAVALKLPNEDDIDIETIKQEAALWESVKGHPNILPIIKADVVDGQMYIASEYASDGSLSSWLKQNGGKAPTHESAIEMMKGILSGLGHLHSKRVIHRDLKPDNILLQANTPRIADFGISRLLKTTVASANTAGTPAYMAPECFEGNRSEKTDLWAAGVIFYQLLTGKLPFPQTDSVSLMGAILTREPEIETALLPIGLEAFIRKALNKNPDLRFQSADEMNKALSALRFDETAERKADHSSSHTAETVAFQRSEYESQEETHYKEKQHQQNPYELVNTVASPKTEAFGEASSTNRIFDAGVQKEENSNRNILIGAAGVAAIVLVLITTVAIYLLINFTKAKPRDNPSNITAPLIANLPESVKIDLPRGMNNSVEDDAMTKTTSSVLTVPNGSEMYLNKVHVSKEELGHKIKQIAQEQTPENRTVYIAADVKVYYGGIVDIMNVVRKQDMDRVTFIAQKNNEGDKVPRGFSVKLPAEPNTEDVNVKPNPNTLVVNIASDGKVKLNMEDFGDVENLSSLSSKLKDIFKYREENVIFREGTNEIEKTIFIKASRSIKYGDVVKVINSVKGAGAEPIGLQLDDLIGEEKSGSEDKSETSAKDETPDNSTSDTTNENGQTDDGKIYNAGEVTEQVRITSKPRPTYTELARTNQITGVVKIALVFKADGTVDSVKAISGLPAGLTENVINAARQIKFVPAKKDGKIVSQSAMIEYTFNIY